jgi:two-component system, chemotaxis family, protein-glutamate methylesterase/glutaminase
MKNKIKVLIIDDSAMVRQVLTDILSSDQDIEVIGTASDPYIAAKKMREEIPDVITLDVEMPKMDGVTFLQKIMQQHPIPVVICSSLTGNRSETTMKVLEYGAVEIIQKPALGTKEYLRDSAIRICDCVKAASMVKVKKISKTKEIMKKLTADAILPKAINSAMVKTTEKVVAVGASTGGTEALRVLFEGLPMDCPGIVVVQHMPENFTKAFAKRLDSLCQPTIKEASNNESVLRGQILIAPGNHHMLLKRSGAKYYVEIKEGPLVSRHRPSVDVLFRSAARYAGKNAIGVIMTGMGDDGAKGLLEMKEQGAFTIAQDESTSVVFGMPQEAIKLNAVDKVLPLDKIAGIILREEKKE